jgi:hypothetical protein
VSDLHGQCILYACHDPAAVVHGCGHAIDDHRTQIDRASVFDRHRDVGLLREVPGRLDGAAVGDDETVDLRGDDLHRDPVSLPAPVAVIDHQPIPIFDRRLDAVRGSLHHRDLLAGPVAQDHLAAILEGDRPERGDRDHGLGPAKVRHGKQKR